jgi:hypothetical protein
MLLGISILLSILLLIYFVYPEANPTIVSYNAKIVNIYNTTSSLVRS